MKLFPVTTSVSSSSVGRLAVSKASSPSSISSSRAKSGLKVNISRPEIYPSIKQEHVNSKSLKTKINGKKGYIHQQIFPP